MKFEDYVDQSMRTKSENFFTDRFSPRDIIGTLLGFEMSALHLDQMKKAIFYGKEPKSKEVLERASWDRSNWLQALFKGDIDSDIVHALLGMITELGEMSEVARAHMNGEDIGYRLTDETGDFFWYMAIWFKALGLDFNEVMLGNLAKLRTRFPDKFDALQAINPNKEREKESLEAAI